MIHEIEVLIKNLEAELTKGSPDRAEIQKRLADADDRHAKLLRISGEIDEILEKHNASSVREMAFRQRDIENSISSLPQKLWDLLTIVRGAGKYGQQAGDRTRWLPSELVKVPEYVAEEAKAKKQIAEAKEALPGITEDLLKVQELIFEAGKI